MLTYNCSRGEETQTTKLNLLQNQYKSRGCGQREGINQSQKKTKNRKWKEMGKVEEWRAASR